MPAKEVPDGITDQKTGANWQAVGWHCQSSPRAKASGRQKSDDCAPAARCWKNEVDCQGAATRCGADVEDRDAHPQTGWRRLRGSNEEVMRQVGDSAGGFSFVLAGLKAWLEHNVRLNLVPDRHPKGIDQ